MSQKVCFFTGFGPVPNKTAAWRRVGYWACHLAKEGYDVVVISSIDVKGEDVTVGSRELKENLKIYNTWMRINSNSLPAYIFNTLSSFLVIPPIFLLERPRVAILSVPSREGIFAAFIGAKLVGAKIVIDYRDEWEEYLITHSKNRIKRVIFRLVKILTFYIYKRSNMVIAVTPLIQEKLHKLLPSNEVILIQNGADTSVFYPRRKSEVRALLGVRPNGLVLVYTGFIGKYYDLETVISAISIAKARGVETSLLVAGWGEDAARIRELAQRAGVDLRYFGPVDDDEMLAKIISSGDVGIIPFRDEELWSSALTTKFFEYAACGLPVIALARDHWLLARVIRENDVGLVVPPERPSALAEAIWRLSNDLDLAREMGARARRMILRSYSREALAKKFLQSLVARGIVEPLERR